jgi:hypothetical protein
MPVGFACQIQMLEPRNVGHWAACRSIHRNRDSVGPMRDESGRSSAKLEFPKPIVLACL